MFRTWNCPQRLIAAAVRMPPMALLNEFLKNFFNGNTTFLDLTGLARLESGNGKESRREFVEAYHGLFPWNILLFLKYSKFENQTPKQLRHIEAELFWGLLISKIAAEDITRNEVATKWRGKEEVLKIKAEVNTEPASGEYYAMIYALHS